MPRACPTSAGISTPVKRRGMASSSSSRRTRRARHSYQLLDLRQDTRHDRVNAGSVRVQAIGLIELGVGGHPVEEEWIEDDRMIRGKAGIDLSLIHISEP